VKVIDNTNLPKVTGLEQNQDVPVTDQMSPEAKALINGLAVVIGAILAAILIADGLLP